MTSSPARPECAPLKIPVGWRWWLPHARYEISTPLTADEVHRRLAARLRGRNSSFWTRTFWRALFAGETILEGRAEQQRFWFNARWKENVSGAIQTAGQILAGDDGSRLSVTAKPDLRWGAISVPLLAVMLPLSLLVLFDALPNRPPAPWSTRILFPALVILGHVVTTRMMWKEIAVGRRELEQILDVDNVAVSASPPFDRIAAGTGRRRWFRLAAMGCGLALALALSEAALRWTYSGDNRNRFVRHAKFHHWHEPNLRLTVAGQHGDFGGHVAHFNHDGLAMRDPLPPPRQPCLAFLGDSFTAGIESAEPQRFVSLVGEALDLPAVNLGCASFSPVLSRVVWEEFSPQLMPAAVVLQVYANDIDGDAQMARQATRDEAGNIVAVPHREALSFFLIRHSALARAVKQTWASRRFAQRQQRRGDAAWQADPWSPAFTRPLEEWFTAEQLAVTTTAVRQLAAAVQARGLSLWLLPIPDRGAVRSRQKDYFSDYWLQFAAENDLPLIDLSQAMTPDNVQQMFFATDIHLTDAGHAVVAQAVIAALGAAGVRGEVKGKLSAPDSADVTQTAPGG